MLGHQHAASKHTIYTCFVQNTQINHSTHNSKQCFTFSAIEIELGLAALLEMGANALATQAKMARSATTLNIFLICMNEWQSRSVSGDLAFISQKNRCNLHQILLKSPHLLSIILIEYYILHTTTYLALSSSCCRIEVPNRAPAVSSSKPEPKLEMAILHK